MAAKPCEGEPRFKHSLKEKQKCQTRKLLKKTSQRKTMAMARATAPGELRVQAK